MNFKHSNYHWQNWVDWINNNATSEKLHFEKKVPKAKRQFYISRLTFTTSFHNLVLKIETGWATSLVKPMSETKNVNGVCTYYDLLFLT